MSNSFVRTGSVDVNKPIDAEGLLLEGLEVFRLRVGLPPMAIRLDAPDSTTLYIGEALPGTAATSPAWRIKKMLTAGTETSILFAEGSSDYEHVWTNHTSYSYP